MGMGMDTLYCETFNAQQSKRFIHTFPYEPSSARAVLRDFAFLVAPSLRIRSAAFLIEHRKPKIVRWKMVAVFKYSKTALTQH